MEDLIVECELKSEYSRMDLKSVPFKMLTTKGVIYRVSLDDMEKRNKSMEIYDLFKKEFNKAIATECIYIHVALNVYEKNKVVELGFEYFAKKLLENFLDHLYEDGSIVNFVSPIDLVFPDRKIFSMPDINPKNKEKVPTVYRYITDAFTEGSLGRLIHGSSSLAGIAVQIAGIRIQEKLIENDYKNENLTEEDLLQMADKLKTELVSEFRKDTTVTYDMRKVMINSIRYSFAKTTKGILKGRLSDERMKEAREIGNKEFEKIYKTVRFGKFTESEDSIECNRSGLLVSRDTLEGKEQDVDTLKKIIESNREKQSKIKRRIAILEDILKHGIQIVLEDKEDAREYYENSLDNEFYSRFIGHFNIQHDASLMKYEYKEVLEKQKERQKVVDKIKKKYNDAIESERDDISRKSNREQEKCIVFGERSRLFRFRFEISAVLFYTYLSLFFTCTYFLMNMLGVETIYSLMISVGGLALTGATVSILEKRSQEKRRNLLNNSCTASIKISCKIRSEMDDVINEIKPSAKDIFEEKIQTTIDLLKGDTHCPLYITSVDYREAIEHAVNYEIELFKILMFYCSPYMRYHKDAEKHAIKIASHLEEYRKVCQFYEKIIVFSGNESNAEIMDRLEDLVSVIEYGLRLADELGVKKYNENCWKKEVNDYQEGYKEYMGYEKDKLTKAIEKAKAKEKLYELPNHQR